jgi:ABC-type antimicrobial peptide transport system permease subunit
MELPIVDFLLPVAVILVASFSIIGFQTLKATKINPANALRNE